jgi:hypothetical protein
MPMPDEIANPKGHATIEVAHPGHSVKRGGELVGDEGGNPTVRTSDGSEKTLDELGLKRQRLADWRELLSESL